MAVKAPWLIIPAFAVTGCRNTSEPASAGPPEDAAKIEQPAASALEAKPHSSARDKGSSPDSTIPQELMTEGLRALGAPFETPVQYRAKGFPAGPLEGGREIRVLAARDGKLKLGSTWTGRLGELFAAEEFEADASGVRQIALGGERVEPPSTFLPARMPVGAKWSAKFAFTRPGDNLRLTISAESVVARRETVTVPLGKFGAIVVAESGRMKGEGVEARISGTTWYAEGVGIVKAVTSYSGKVRRGSKAEKVSIELVAIPPPKG